ncbi:MAG TPA: hypothetical protein VGV64_03760 [Thermoplasmata archaeon]|nr:hypothetical protein [Thermoplasmata archaeon]
MPPLRSDRAVGRVLDAERSFIVALGGYAVEIAGARLLVHERIPVPRLNFVEVGRVARARQAAFFERALDHYFQRALRPTFRVPEPVEEHLDRALRSFGFVPSPERLSLLEGPVVRTDAPSRPVGPDLVVRTHSPDGFPDGLPFWTAPSEREELSRALEVLLFHPNDDEELRLELAESDGRSCGAALRYTDGSTAGLWWVAASPGASRGTTIEALHRAALQPPLPGGLERLEAVADDPESLEPALSAGFDVVGTRAVYELPPTAELHLPAVGPAGPPRWRPPRRPGPS